MTTATFIPTNRRVKVSDAIPALTFSIPILTTGRTTVRVVSFILGRVRTVLTIGRMKMTNVRMTLQKEIIAIVPAGTVSA